MIRKIHFSLPIMTLSIFLLLQPDDSAAGAPGEQLKQSIEKTQSILTDPSLKGEGKAQERRQKLKEIINARFDFNEMAKRSLGAQWQKRSPEEQKEFVRLFTNLLEGSYLDKLESYHGEKVRYVNEKQDTDFAELNTKVVNAKGEEFSLDYRLRNADGDWKVIDVVIENVSLVNNYRAQFNRVIARSSYNELLQALKQKKFSAPGAKS